MVDRRFVGPSFMIEKLIMGFITGKPWYDDDTADLAERTVGMPVVIVGLNCGRQHGLAGTGSQKAQPSQRP